MKRYIPFLLLCFCFTLSAYSQPYVDVFTIKYANYNKTAFKDNLEEKVSFGDFYTSIFLPFKLKNSDAIVLGAYYDQLDFKLQAPDTLIHTDHARLKMLNIQAGYQHSIGKEKKWMLTYLLFPAINAEKIAFRNRNFQLGGYTLATYKFKNKLRYRFGLYYNREFYGNHFVPLAGFDYKVNSKWHINALLPLTLNVEYKLRDKLYTGVLYKTGGPTYRLSSPSDHYILEGRKLGGHVLLRNYYHYYLKKNIVLFAQLGYDVFRQFEEYNNDNRINNDNLIFNKYKSGFILDGGIALRVRFDEEYND